MSEGLGPHAANTEGPDRLRSESEVGMHPARLHLGWGCLNGAFPNRAHVGKKRLGNAWDA